MLKIYFLSSEILPFSTTYSLSSFSKEFSITLNKNKNIDIRLAQPKYGYISDRRYILREVIRLKDLKIDFCNKEHLINIKSGFIPDSRVQVYFTEHKDFFSTVPDLIYKSRNGRIYNNNPEKYSLFSVGAIKTLEKLFWIPDILICNDWQLGLLPIIFNQYYKKNFKKMKIIFLCHSYNKNYLYPTKLLKKLKLPLNCNKEYLDILCDTINESSFSYILDNESKTISKQLPTVKKKLANKKSKT